MTVNLVSKPFKAKTLVDGEWVFGQLFQTKYSYTSEYDWWTDAGDNKGKRKGNETVTIILSSPLSLYYTVTGDPYIDTDVYPIVNPETICRSVGTTDKNNTQIFENDIVKTKYGRMCRVIWNTSDKYLMWSLKALETEHDFPDEEDLWLPNNLEVVGNVFDNPELLEAVNNG